MIASPCSFRNYGGINGFVFVRHLRNLRWRS
jgi:hypothetical protein